MNLLCFILSAVLLGHVAFAAPTTPPHIAKEFLELDFFADGRGMILSPNLVKAYNFAFPGLGVLDRKLFTRRWGMVYNDRGKLAGFQEHTYESNRYGVIGCAACHSGRAAGRFVVGLGNKNIDVLQLGKDVNRIERFWQNFVPSIFKNQSYIEGEAFALQFSKYLSDERLGNLTQGLVPVAFIQGWFFKIQGIQVPRLMPKGQVKVPFLWGYGEKRKVGQFCDGFGDGELPGWAIAVELTAGQHPETVRSYHDKIVRAEDMFSELLPPPYPFEIDQNLAARGKEVFESTCMACHGTYSRSADSRPIFEVPKRIPWEVVKTDKDRLLVKDPEFLRLVDNNPLSDILKMKHLDDGYFAPRLEGLWSRFPYLHNGSVPSVADLLTPKEQRPQVFSLRDAGESYRFSKSRLGLTSPTAKELSSLKTAASRGARDVYATKRVGHSNSGHPFGTDLPKDQKRALIEYLKTL